MLLFPHYQLNIRDCTIISHHNIFKVENTTKIKKLQDLTND